MGVRSPKLSGHGDDFAWSLLDAVPDATLVVAADGEILFVNDKASSVLGWPEDELVGTTVERLVPEASRQVHRAHRTRYQAEPTVRGMGVGLELRAEKGDGEEIPVEISLSPLRLGDGLYVIATVRDISDRVEAAERLSRVIRTLDATPDAIMIFDADTLRYAFVNQGAVRLLGYARDELLAMTPLHVNPYTDEREYRSLVDDLRSGAEPTVVREARLLAKDGSEIPVEKTLHAAPTGRDGRTWIITLARDIRARLDAERELQESRADLAAAERAVAVAEDRERIARDLHDTVIQRLFGEGLNLQATLSMLEEPERVRGRLHASIDTLDDTIKDLRIAIFSLQHPREAGGVGLRRDLAQIVSDAAAGIGPAPRLELAGAIEDVEPHVAEHLVPVLREALANVAKHAHASEVRACVTVGEGEVDLTVEDDGVGVPDDVIGGHGLANMAERAEQLGGTMVAERRPEGGTSLRWCVPRGRA